MSQSFTCRNTKHFIIGLHDWILPKKQNDIYINCSKSTFKFEILPEGCNFTHAPHVMHLTNIMSDVVPKGLVVPGSHPHLSKINIKLSSAMKTASIRQLLDCQSVYFPHPRCPLISSIKLIRINCSWIQFTSIADLSHIKLYFALKTALTR